MTESSYFWDDDTIGDGPLSADISDDEISLINLLMYAYDRTACHVGQYDTTDSHFINQANRSLFVLIVYNISTLSCFNGTTIW